ASKGLEFPCVFLVGMEEDLLPHKKSVEESFDIEEERRLCYVGITRAQQKLSLLGTSRRKKYGVMQTRAASRFLEEIPGEVLRRSIGDAPSTSTEEEKDQLARTAFANIKSMLGD
ncbi:MAG: 3'-5' exonuclease, partial [Syntrophotalea acetylenica]|nr:3'-5' exonuclease [Syntrophotalea acetylenica]